MLGESFLQLLSHREYGEALAAPDHGDSLSACPHTTPPSTRAPASLMQVKESSTAKDQKLLGEQKHGQRALCPHPLLQGPGPGLAAPLLTSFDQVYPDIQLGGELGREATSALSNLYLGPEDVQPLHTQAQDESRPQMLQMVPPEAGPPPDDGYLVMDRSITLHGNPLTNSMLNVYLDQKLQEVYSQYLQERLACSDCTPGCSLLPLLPQACSQQKHQQQQQQVPHWPAPSYLNTQRSSIAAASSHFSSPELRISNPGQVKRPEAPGHL